MQDLPHHYTAVAEATTEGEVYLTGFQLEAIRSAPPAEFGGPGNRWSPETLLIAAVADCFTLSFRAIARASQLSWASLRCEVEGTLARIDGTTKFSHFTVQATLTVPADTNQQRAHRLLQKAEESCLITNSLSASTHLEIAIIVAPTVA